MDLILHIGDKKTASTYIQKNLLNNYKLLLKNKVYYPILKKKKDTYT